MIDAYMQDRSHCYRGGAQRNLRAGLRQRGVRAIERNALRRSSYAMLHHKHGFTLCECGELARLTTHLSLGPSRQLRDE